VSIAQFVIGTVGEVGFVVGMGAGFGVFPGSGLAASGSYIDKASACRGAIVMVATNSEVRTAAIAIVTMIIVALACLLFRIS
jgi:hypothetical protein